MGVVGKKDEGSEEFLISEMGTELDSCSAGYFLELTGLSDALLDPTLELGHKVGGRVGKEENIRSVLFAP